MPLGTAEACGGRLLLDRHEVAQRSAEVEAGKIRVHGESVHRRLHDLRDSQYASRRREKRESGIAGRLFWAWIGDGTGGASEGRCCRGDRRESAR